jgi:hypothetical protein
MGGNTDLKKSPADVEIAAYRSSLGWSLSKPYRLCADANPARVAGEARLLTTY